MNHNVNKALVRVSSSIDDLLVDMAKSSVEHDHLVEAEKARQRLVKAFRKRSLSTEDMLQRVLQGLDGYPEVIKLKNMNDWTLLHSACGNKAPLAVILLLVDRWPESVQEVTSLGSTALHCACYHRAPLDVIQCLVKRYPQSLLTQNYSGFLPLHYACYRDNHSCAPLEVVQFLVNEEPLSCLFGSNRTESPWDRAATSSSAKELAGSEVVEWLTLCITDAACAFMDTILHSSTGVPLVAIQVSHALATKIPYKTNPSLKKNGAVLTELLLDRASNKFALLRKLLRNEWLQNLIWRPDFRRLVAGFYAMNKAGRSTYLSHNPRANRKIAMHVLDVVIDDVDCLFLHLRENPWIIILCSPGYCEQQQQSNNERP